MFDTKQLKAFVLDTLHEFFGEQNTKVYKEFSDKKEFLEVSGLSDGDFEKIVHHPTFEPHVHRLDGSAKRYIHTKSGLNALMKIFKDVS